MPIVFLYGMALFVIGYRFFRTEHLAAQWGYTALAVTALTGFALSLFPSLQIAIGAVACALMVVCLRRDGVVVHLNRGLLARTLAVVVCVGAIVGSFIWSSSDDFKALMGTSYPGSRVSRGGAYKPRDALSNLHSLFLPFKDSNVSNNCEVATFIHFGPLCMALYVYVRSKLGEKAQRERIVGDCFLALLIVELTFMLFEFPEWFVKLNASKLQQSHENLYGWTATLFSMWFVHLMWRYQIKLSLKTLMISLSVFALAYGMCIDGTSLEYLTPRYAILGVAVLTIMAGLAFVHRKVVFYILTSAVMLFCGSTVNPLCRGIAPITNHPISQVITEVSSKDPNAVWLSTGDNNSFTIANFAMANGARVLNGTSFYPSGEYEVLDPDHEYFDTYNRYSNEIIYLNNEKTWFESPRADVVTVHLDYDDLRLLSVGYLITPKDEQHNLAAHGIGADLLLLEDGYRVYKLNYS